MLGTAFHLWCIPMMAWSAFTVTAHQSRLDTHLRAWTQQSHKIKDFKREYECKQTDLVFHQETLSYVTVTGATAGLIRLDVRGKDRALRSTALLHDRKLHLYEWSQRSELVLTWPPDNPIRGASAGWWDTSMLGFRDWSFILAGIPPQDLTRRYAVSLESQDVHYVYVRSKPGSKEMQSVFEEAQAAFDKKDYTLRVLSVCSPPSVQCCYTLRQRQINLSPPVTAATLVADLTGEWKISQHPPR